MEIYLPIAEIPVNIILILALGLVAGFLAGMFGVGGGFLSTPLLIFIGIPPAVAVSTSANQIIAAGVSGLLTHLKRRSLDMEMGLFLVLGGLFGSSVGVIIFKILQKLGQIDIAIGLSYIVFLGFIGVTMLMDSVKIIAEKRYGISLKKKKGKNLQLFLDKIDKLPLQYYFKKSDVTTSIIVPIVASFLVGILVSLMGIGGGFMLIPVMIYILRMPANMVIGTSVFQMVFISINTTFLQATTNHTVDIVLAFLLIISSVFGAQIGCRSGQKADPDNLRLGLSLIILVICGNMFLNLFTTPSDFYTVEILR